MAFENSQPRIGLVLSGGGARGAYQAGVLRALAEISSAHHIPIPFPIVTGVSAGAINAAFIASKADNFLQATEQLCEIWKNVSSDQVFRTDALSMGRIGMRLIADIGVGSLAAQKTARSLLDTAPLRVLLDQIPFERIDAHIESGYLQALAITALDYATSCNVTFVQGNPDTPSWRRIRRQSVRATISADHIMASSAIPLFFPPIRVEDRFYGDGCLRNTAPLSPAVHLDADRLVIIGVRKPAQVGDLTTAQPRPSVARILSIVLNGVLLDAIDTDVERLSKVNETMESVPQTAKDEMNYKPISYSWIQPSEDLGKLAIEFTDRLPKIIRYLLGGLGSASESSELTSYLLFEPGFCGKLVDLGYKDGMAHKSDLLTLLALPPTRAASSL